MSTIPILSFTSFVNFIASAGYWTATSLTYTIWTHNRQWCFSKHKSDGGLFPSIYPDFPQLHTPISTLQAPNLQWQSLYLTIPDSKVGVASVWLNSSQFQGRHASEISGWEGLNCGFGANDVRACAICPFRFVDISDRCNEKWWRIAVEGRKAEACWYTSWS
jgi:hypothetical protein